MLHNPLRPDDILAGRYRVSGVRRVTGLSALYEARDLQAGEPDGVRYAVKEELLEAETPSKTADLVREFERKVAVFKTLDHPAIPRILDGFAVDEQAYLVMEFIEGNDLEDVINDARDFLPSATIYRWAVELCDALAYLHTRKPHPLVFRDIKPSNIMIDLEGRAKLIDYGIAEFVEEGREYSALGTDGYAAPEQYTGAVSPLIDMYGLGATLHHLLTRTDPRLQPPFSFGKRLPRTFNPEVPWGLGAIVMRALAYNPEDRFASMADMLEALQQIKDTISV
jgi:eukaryotic-like serine/threonine-protein kinase